MALVGCFVTPHPPIIIPEVGGSEVHNAEPTALGMRAVRDRTAALAPDTIVLLSPHAPLGYQHMAVSFATSYHGSFAYFRAPSVRVDVDGDPETARAILDAATEAGVPVVPVDAGRQVTDLDHGSMVPLYFLMAGLKKPCRLVLLSFSQLGIEEHVRFGETIGRPLLETSARIVYVASGDMSHRLLSDGPYGYDPRGPQFDHAVAEAFEGGDWDELVSIPRGIVTGAGECGFRSLAVLKGLVTAVESAGIATKNHLLSYEGPFGVGYLVGEVEFLRQSQERGSAQ
jgi:aromatic ring-opening dioxygenase LigB subunit